MKRTLILTIIRALFPVILFLPAFAAGQGLTITGLVTDGTDRMPLPGATIVELGTTNGTVTGTDGTFSIAVAGERAVLVISYIGYHTVEEPVSGRRYVEVSLLPDQTELDEVVVIGYGVQKKSDLTGAISVVDGEELMKSNPVNIGQSLQGKVAGVSVITSSGQPGAGTSIKIRGIGSISNSTDPLFVVDGVLIDNKWALNSLNPDDIASISVLKDASAAAIYGSRASNGVVVITTKMGTTGKTEISFSSYTGITKIPKYYNVMNADEYADFSSAAWDAFIAENPTAQRPDVFSDSARAVNGAEDNNWLDLITQTGYRENYSLTMSNATEDFRYHFGLNYYKESGVLINTGYKRFSGRFNSELKVNKWLTVGENLSINYDQSEYTSHKGENPWRLATISSPLMPVYDSTNVGGYAGPFDYITGPNDKSNPFAEQMLNENRASGNRLLGSAYASAAILPGLTYKIEAAVNHAINYVYKYSPEYELARAWSNASSTLEESYSRSTDFQLNNLLTYSHNWMNHNLQVMAGQSMEMLNLRDLGAVGKEIAYDKRVMSLAQTISKATGGEYDDRFSSLFGRVNYDYKGKYLLTATLRRDGSSRFGPGNRYGLFPSFSFGWKINEDLLQAVESVNMLKLRAGWGKTGNANIGRYLYIDRINNPLETRYPFGEEETIYYGGTIIRSFANPDVRWEGAAMTNVGADVSMFGNRLMGSVEYYYKNQDGMLIEREQYHFFGRQQESARQPVNLGRITNKGFEFNLSYRKSEGNLQYSLNANLTTIHNTVQSLPDGEALITGSTITKEGHTVGSFYGWVAERIIQESDFDADGNYKYARQSEGTAPGDIKFRDLNRDGTINALDQTIIGKPVPDFIYGFSTDLSFKGFDLNLFFEGVYGNEIYNSRRSEIGIATEPSTKNWNRLREVMDYWTPENASTTMTRPSVVDVNDNQRTSTWFIEDGSYLRLKSAQVGYTFPVDLIREIRHIRIYFSGTNLLTVTGYSGLDPEINSDSPVYSGIDSGNYPIPRTFMGGIQVNF